MIKKDKIKIKKKKKERYSTISISEAQHLARRIKKLTGINVFEKTRLQDNVYIRSVFNYCLSKTYHWGLTKIARFYQSNGYTTYDHATVWHSLNMFELYVRYEKSLITLYETLTSSERTKHNLSIIIFNKMQTLEMSEMEAINALTDKFYEESTGDNIIEKKIKDEAS